MQTDEMPFLMKLKPKRFLMKSIITTNSSILAGSISGGFLALSYTLTLKIIKFGCNGMALEDDIGEAPVQMGVPKEAIVIGFHPAYVRQYTEIKKQTIFVTERFIA